MRFFFIFMLLFLTKIGVQAQESFSIDAIKFEVKQSNALVSIEKVLRNPTNLIKSYKPVGASISNRVIRRNEVSFIASKTILFLTKKVSVKSVFSVDDSSHICPADQIGYVLNVNFVGSDDIVTDNIDQLDAHFCLKEKSNSLVTVKVGGSIVKGPSYNVITGQVARNMIEAQMGALVAALLEEVRK